MRKLLIVVVVFVGTLLVGCDGVADSHAERKLRMERIGRLQGKMIMDDSDFIWMLDRSTRLSKYNPRVGD